MKECDIFFFFWGGGGVGESKYTRTPPTYFKGVKAPTPRIYAPIAGSDACECRWNGERRVVCGGRMTVYGGEFARLQGGVVMDGRRAAARRRGGERLDTVIGQSEQDELYRLSAGFFVLSNCTSGNITSTSRPATFHSGNYLNDWITATRLEHAVRPRRLFITESVNKGL